jgi:F0F1-type ATP synthase epsilon subunit
VKLRLYKPDALVIASDVAAVVLPGAAGELTPMPGHDLLLTPLMAGRLSLTPADGSPRRSWRIDGGIAEIRQESITVFTGRVDEVAGADE